MPARQLERHGALRVVDECFSHHERER
jgi:hypothetical protein